MLEILLIRHGETERNRTRRIMGHRPIPLNVRGRSQARALQRRLKKVELEVIYTSPIRRAVETARVLAKGRRVRTIKVPEMAEIDYGHWVGRTFDEVSFDPAYRTYHTTPRKARAPGGESMREVYRRAVSFIEKLRRRHRGGRVVVISHADVIKAIMVRYLKLDLNDLLKIRIDNCALSSVLFNGTHHKVLAINAHSELHRLFHRTDQLLPTPR